MSIAAILSPLSFRTDAMAVGAAFDAVPPKSIEIAIDRGGTFTDVWAKIPGHADLVIKLLSVNPETYDDAPAEGKLWRTNPV